MPRRRFPTLTRQRQTGESGVNAVSTIINDEIGWIFRRVTSIIEYEIFLFSSSDMFSRCVISFSRRKFVSNSFATLLRYKLNLTCPGLALFSRLRLARQAK